MSRYMMAADGTVRLVENDGTVVDAVTIHEDGTTTPADPAPCDCCPPLTVTDQSASNSYLMVVAALSLLPVLVIAFGLLMVVFP